jgi:nitrate reductase NapD
MSGSGAAAAAARDDIDAAELHIASLVVHAAARSAERVAAAIAAMPGARVHASAPTGKLVVTLEASSAEQVLSCVRRIEATAGVLSAALVFQCADTLQAMNEVLPDADCATRVH